MPKVNREQLKKVQDLYEKNGITFPQLLADAEKNVDCLNKNDFTGLNASRSSSESMHYDYHPLLARAAVAIAPTMMMDGKNFQTLTFLILKEFLEMSVALDQKNKIHKIISVKQRLKLFHELFVADQTPLELSATERQKFSQLNTTLVNHFLNYSHKVDIFDVNKAMTEFHVNLNNLIQNLSEQIPTAGNDKHLSHLLDNVKKQMAKLNDQKNELNRTFDSLTNRDGLLSRSEQKRHDMHVQLKLLLREFEAINSSIVNLISYVEDRDTPLSTREKIKEIAKSIDKLLNINFSTCANLILWHVSTEEGRCYDLNQLTSLISADFDIHIIQNPLTPEAKEQVDQYFNPLKLSLKTE